MIFIPEINMVKSLRALYLAVDLYKYNICATRYRVAE